MADQRVVEAAAVGATFRIDPLTVLHAQIEDRLVRAAASRLVDKWKRG